MTFKQRFDIAWRLLRPFTLTASVVPVLVGSGIAFSQHHAQWGLFIAFLVASILIQAATNMFNEYFDYRRGLDHSGMVGIAGTIVRDGVQPATVLATAWTFIGVSVLLGVYICLWTTWWIAVVGTACLAVAYLYSGGPKPLAYTPFGELVAALAMGPVIVLLAYYLQTGTISGSALWVSVPIGLLIGAILLGNNFRDMDQDRLGGRRTVVILLGRKRGRILFGVVFTAAYLVIIGMVVSQILTPWALLVLVTVPTAWYVSRLYFRYSEAKQLHPAVKGTSGLLLRFGGLLFVAFLVSTWFPIH
ncbi:1,4-dihydroxy-2-naphthoate polyprenyltransferase [Alicyclobacillaceae bacterium I2511]|nr:1,4-dihydroxy-2-naphthoate polyprenyltransferase [Alicyclobacillaceae bacterium I2511]